MLRSALVVVVVVALVGACEASARLSMWDWDCFVLDKSSSGFNSACGPSQKKYANPIINMGNICKGVKNSCQKCQTSLLYFFRYVFDDFTGGIDENSIEPLRAVWSTFSDVEERSKMWLLKTGYQIPSELDNKGAKKKRKAYLKSLKSAVNKATSAFCTQKMKPFMTGFLTKLGIHARSSNLKMCKNLVDFFINSDLDNLEVFLVDGDGVPVDPPKTEYVKPLDIMKSLGMFYANGFTSKIGQKFAEALSPDSIPLSVCQSKTCDPNFVKVAPSLKAFARDICACGNCGCDSSQCGLKMPETFKKKTTESGTVKAVAEEDPDADAGPSALRGIVEAVTEPDTRKPKERGSDDDIRRKAIGLSDDKDGEVSTSSDEEDDSEDEGEDEEEEVEEQVPVTADTFANLRSFLDNFLVLDNVLNVMNLGKGPMNTLTTATFENVERMSDEERDRIKREEELANAAQRAREAELEQAKIKEREMQQNIALAAVTMRREQIAHKSEESSSLPSSLPSGKGDRTDMQEAMKAVKGDRDFMTGLNDPEIENRGEIPDIDATRD